MSKVISPLFFDLETINTFEEVDNDYTKLRFSVAITRRHKQNHCFLEKDIRALVEQLDGADLIVGYNHVSFDFKVIKGYGIPQTQIDLWIRKSFDVMLELQNIVCQRISLDHLSKRNLKGNPGKLAPGSQCPIWYKQGKIEKIEELCMDDVERLSKIFGLIICERPLKISQFWLSGNEKFSETEVTIPIPEKFKGVVWQ